MSHPKLKISRPNLPQILMRERLYCDLDKALDKPLTWVAAPPGSGKTTLLASYLGIRKISSIWYRMDERDCDIATFFHFMGEAANSVIGPEVHCLPDFLPPHQQRLNSYSKTYFETLFALLPLPFTFIFDDFQDFGEDSEIVNVILSAVEIAPAGISFVVMGRSMPPYRLVKFQANRLITLLTWEDVRFTIDETRELISLLAPEKEMRSEDNLADMLDGWATGVVLKTVADRGGIVAANAWHGQESGANFAYFASEVLARLEGDIRQFLLRSAFLPWMTVAMCRQLTGYPDAYKILLTMHNRCLFTERINGAVPVYKYHSLFREFLQKNACETLPPQEIACLKQTAAWLLEESGAVEEAAAIHLNTGSLDLLINLVNSHAGKFMRQGREKIIFQWIEAIPEHVASRSHVILYWKGVAALSMGERTAKDLFISAFELSRGKDDSIMLLSWAGIINAINIAWDDFIQLDEWISWLEQHLAANPCYPSAEVECQVALSISWSLTYRQPHRRETLSEWLLLARKLASESGDPYLIANSWVTSANYYAWMGDHPMFGMALGELKKMCKSGQSSGLTTVISFWLEGVFLACSKADPKSAIAISEAGLAKSRLFGIGDLEHLFHATAVYSMLIEENLDDAEKALASMHRFLNANKRHSYAHFYFLSAWHALLKDDLQEASTYAERAVRFAEETGLVFAEILCRLALSRVQHETGEDETARENLNRAISQALPTGSDMLIFMCRLWEALFSSETSESQRTSVLLKEAFGLGRRNGYLNLFWWWLPDDMSRLCGLALERGIEADYAQKLVKERGLKPLNRRYQVEAWPWAIKIYTLGRFGIVKNGAPLSFNGKVQQKPLALLKAIIAFGGRNVSEEQLVESLWPESEGDVGHQAFATTLHRLRKIIDSDQVLTFSEGKVSLSPLCCWVDVWAFERLVNELLDDRKGHKDQDALLRGLDKSLALYTGHFLESEESQLWAISTRERLRNKLLRLIGNAGKLLEKQGELAQAVTLYHRGLECDNMIEDFYQRLMACYSGLGNRGEMIATFNSCCAVMNALGTTPSSRSSELFEQLFYKK